MTVESSAPSSAPSSQPMSSAPSPVQGKKTKGAGKQGKKTKASVCSSKVALFEAKVARLDSELEEQKKIQMLLRQEIDQLRRRE